jgi:hypothetical protein
MKRLLVCLTLMTLGLCQAEVPKLFTKRAFNSSGLAEAANHFIAIGEAATIEELEKVSLEDASHAGWISNRGFCESERIGWVCRILYEPKGKSPLRAPAFGILSIPENTMPIEKWPLFPVALSGSTYVVLKQGYTSDSRPEELKHYMAYCKNNGVFRTAPIPVPTREQAEQDIANLRQSGQWQAIQWESNDGFSYPMGEQLTWGFIQSQTKTIANESIVKQNSKTDPAALSLR